MTRKSLWVDLLIVQILRAVAAELNISKQQGLFLKNCLLQRDQRRQIYNDLVIFLKQLKIHLFTFLDNHCLFIHLFFAHSISRCVQMRKGWR